MKNVPHDEQAWLRRVQQLTGIDDVDAARRIGRAVCAVLLEQLSAPDRAWLSRALPPAFVTAAGSAEARPLRDDSLQDFYERVAAREGAPPGLAREHAQSVCRSLAELLHDEDLRRLARRLSDEVAALLLPSGTAPKPATARERPRARRERRTLAEGRPGSSKPLSEARPQRVHGDSVAHSDNPHGDTKLSSSAGTTQEREAETLAQGRPKP
jgi:uncharacterized protein (DUF2267 family)